MIRFKDIKWHKSKFEILTRTKELIEIRVFDVDIEDSEGVNIKIKIFKPTTESFMIFKNETQVWEECNSVKDPIGECIVAAHSKMDHKKCSIHSQTSIGRLVWGFWCDSYETEIEN